MKNTISSQSRMYFSEVLGIKYYLCPESIYNLRSLEGGLPCKVLAVVFQALPFSQKELLKKIMNSVNIFEYTLLQIKNPVILQELLSSEEELAESIFFFGGENLLKEILPAEEKSFSNEQKPVTQKLVSFLQFFSLAELDGTSSEVINKKKQIWTKLQNWKKYSGY